MCFITDRVVERSIIDRALTAVILDIVLGKLVLTCDVPCVPR